MYNEFHQFTVGTTVPEWKGCDGPLHTSVSRGKFSISHGRALILDEIGDNFLHFLQQRGRNDVLHFIAYDFDNRPVVEADEMTVKLFCSLPRASIQCQMSQHSNDAALCP